MSQSVPLVPGHVYHIFNRGNNAETIFRSEENFRFFLKRYAHYVAPVAETYAYCLMSNHFHFASCIRRVATGPLDLSDKLRLHQIEAFGQLRDDGALAEDFDSRRVLTPEIVSHQFMRLFTSYSKAFNKQFGRTGALLEKPFKRKLVATDAYVTELIRYIHNNPVKHGFVAEVEDWPWTSYAAICGKGRTQIARERVLDWFEGEVESFRAHHLMPSDEALFREILFD